MQDRYVGDFGDLVKLSILRALRGDARLGIAWWHYPDESHNGDGRHIGYLNSPEKWRGFDPDLFDGLHDIVSRADRRIAALEESGLLPDAIFHNTPVLGAGTPAQRRTNRDTWFGNLKETLVDCDLIFIDPDNGLEPGGYSVGKQSAGKSVTFSELQALSKPGRALIVYHHHTRMAGGHLNELTHWAEKLVKIGFTSISAIRSKSYSPRAFFLLNASPELKIRAKAFVNIWNGYLSWHDDLHIVREADRTVSITLQIKESVIASFKVVTGDYKTLMSTVLEAHVLNGTGEEKL